MSHLKLLVHLVTNLKYTSRKKPTLLATAILVVILITSTSCNKNYTCTCTSAPAGLFTKLPVQTITTLTEKSSKSDATAWCMGLQNANPGLNCTIQ